ncbi:hypothetical protein BJ546DRAFT_161760 [Cryomyces antarcticus]
MPRYLSSYKGEFKESPRSRIGVPCDKTVGSQSSSTRRLCRLKRSRARCKHVCMCICMFVMYSCVPCHVRRDVIFGLQAVTRYTCNREKGIDTVWRDSIRDSGMQTRYPSNPYGGDLERSLEYPGTLHVFPAIARFRRALDILSVVHFSFVIRGASLFAISARPVCFRFGRHFGARDSLYRSEAKRLVFYPQA